MPPPKKTKLVSGKAANAGKKRRLRRKVAKKQKTASQAMVSTARRRRRNKKSDLEEAFSSWLQEEGIEYRYQFAVGRCHADFFLPPRLLVEVNGCYWHGCPDCYGKKGLRKRLKDARRYAFFRRRGFEVLVVWGCQMKSQKRTILKKIRERLMAEVN